MTRKEQRITEIMMVKNTDYDVAERLFLDELEERYPDLSGGRLDIAEMLYELANG